MFVPKQTGKYIFTLTSDDGSYMWFNQQYTNLSVSNLFINNGETHAPINVSAETYLTMGIYYPIFILYGQGINTYAFTLTFIAPDGSSNKSGLTSSTAGVYYN